MRSSHEFMQYHFLLKKIESTSFKFKIETENMIRSFSKNKNRVESFGITLSYFVFYESANKLKTYMATQHHPMMPDMAQIVISDAGNDNNITRY